MFIRRLFKLILICSLFGGGTANAESDDAMLGSDQQEPSDADADTGESFFTSLSLEQQQAIINRAYPLMAAKWNDTSIFVCWEEFSDEFTAQRDLVKAAITDTWQAQSALEFLGWGPCNELSQGIRISVQDVGPHTTTLGKFLNGKPDGMVLNFIYQAWTPQCQTMADFCTRTMAVHEFGHAIGFSHEQNRPDTPDDCKMQQKPQGENGDDIEMTPWDIHSVMNYCNPTYTNGGVLSKFDVLALQQIYGDAS